jgi:hypothetical protein
MKSVYVRLESMIRSNAYTIVLSVYGVQHSLPLRDEFVINNIWEFSPYLKENITRYHHKDQLVNAFYGNSACLHWESYKKKHKYKIQDLYTVKATGAYSYHWALKG